jgi:hypothetical protein
MFFLDRLKTEFSRDSDGRIPYKNFVAHYGGFARVRMTATA